VFITPFGAYYYTTVGELGQNLSPSKLRSSLDSCEFVKVFGDESLNYILLHDEKVFKKVLCFFYTIH
jgi:hypothetical protein